MDPHLGHDSPSPATPTRSRWLTGTRFALVFAGVYLLLRAAWPWLEGPYSQLVYLEIDTAARGVSASIEVDRIAPQTRKGTQGLAFDLEIRRGGATVGRSIRETELWPVFVSSRYASFEPTALLLALLVATPVSLRRRAGSLLAAPVLLHALLLTFLVAEVHYSLWVDLGGSMGIFEYALVSLLSHAGAQAETHTILPVLLWVAFFPDILIGQRGVSWLRERAQVMPRDA